ncbi:Crp/Fnr family transcriptional regulator [Thermoflexibacter ruber]|uniref:cAMP-binding domain of CRP or a regulatory subunit of cAMP-dependent protein kinases n=1 Tax=Thermoflexibacter ruber TaxID=1003 RepID=A0A1I2JXP0_9BACT|nr:Crp/Fnr family transcriptional regulator [Thermoflexibacter ruber]SFF59622.1 cAMP-binding domain of CRP or a regulatory subunit of cAMP-dependent protein kinases [Thermoflexibacter ruber]
MDEFRKFIENYTTLSDSDWKVTSACFEKRTIQKDEILLQEGKICRHLYFIESGLLRYYVNKDGNNITKYFTEAPYCFTSQVSFTAETPATENIQAIEKSVIWQTTLKQANDLLELKSWSTFVRKLIQEVQYYTEEILQEIQTETAENRYKKMIETNPQLLQRVPLKYLASYFGIAPQSLSRIRKKIAKEDRT